MKDRLLLVALILLLLISAATLFTLWLAQRETRQVNAALLAQLQRLSEPPTPTPAPAPPDQAVLRVRAIQGSRRGRPLAGLTLALKGAPFSEKEETLTAVTDPAGLAAFGPIRPGPYTLSIPDPDRRNVFHLADSITVTLYGGQSATETLQCPLDLAAPSRAVSLDLAWDDAISRALDLGSLSKNEFFLVGGTLTLEPQIIAGRSWVAEPIRFLTTLEGDFITNYELGLSATRRIPMIKITDAKSFGKTQPLPAGRYYLTRLFIRKGAVGPGYLPVNYMKELAGDDPPAIDVSPSGNEPLRIPIPDAFRKGLLAAYAKEATLDLHAGAIATFRDLLLTPGLVQFAGRDNPFNIDYALLGGKELEMQGKVIREGESITIDRYELTLQQSPNAQGSDAYRVRVRWRP